MGSLLLVWALWKVRQQIARLAGIPQHALNLMRLEYVVRAANRQHKQRGSNNTK